jgi:hypothetical protein
MRTCVPKQIYMHSKSKFFIGSFLLIVLLGLIANLAVAQSTARVGIKGGFNVSNLYVDDVDDENPRIGFHAGVYGQIFSSDVFAIQPEILFSTKGSRGEYSEGFGPFTADGDIKFNLNYLELPVLAVFKLGDAAEIHVGPYFSYLLSANVDVDGDIDGYEDLERDNFNAWDYGIAAGVGFNLGNAQIGARYNYGLQKLANSDGADAVLGDSKNSCAQVYISFNLNGN